MKTLYISDLDGTLLNSSQQTSDYTNKSINSLVKSGMLFSYATARAYETASTVTVGMNAQFPVILHNGAYILDSKTGEILLSNYIENAEELISELISAGIYPIVFTLNGNKEKFSFIPTKSPKGVMNFAKERINDPRYNPVASFDEIDYNEVFYITCIDDASKLMGMYDKYKGIFHCEYQVNMYTKEQWLEIMPKSATKANAVIQLKKMLGCDKVVCFGDETNDIDMFKIADECYAVSNAVDELKQIATAVIGSNNDNAVAKWLEENYCADSRKLILLDLDGTLLRDDKTISDYTLKTLNACKKLGYLIGISTARGESNARQYIASLNPDIIISSSGALVKNNDKIIGCFEFAEKETERLIGYSLELTDNKCEITVDTVDKHYWNYKQDPHIMSPDWGNVIYTDYSNFSERSLKICVELDNEFLARQIANCIPDCDWAHFSDGNWYKFTKATATKSNAIKAVSDSLGILKENIIAFGDDFVDIEMIKMCGIGIAMGNAIDEVKNTADFVAADNNNDGVAKWLEENVILLKNKAVH